MKKTLVVVIISIVFLMTTGSFAEILIPNGPVREDNKHEIVSHINNNQRNVMIMSNSNYNTDNVRRRRRQLDQVYPYEDAATPDECDPDADVMVYLYNADTDMPIGPLGDTIDLCSYGDTGLALVATPECKRFVVFALYNAITGAVILTKIEGEAPFSLGGDIGENLIPVKKLKKTGSYELRVDPKPGSKKIFNFEIVDC